MLWAPADMARPRLILIENVDENDAMAVVSAALLSLPGYDWKVLKTEARDYGDTTTQALRSIYNTKSDSLRLELAAMLDIRCLVSTTYDLEGDRLEIMLTYNRIEELRSFGRAIKAKQDGCLPNVDATLRKLMKLKKDVIIEKYYASHGVCTAKLVKTEKVASSL